jgi:hypothetical protein
LDVRIANLGEFYCLSHGFEATRKAGKSERLWTKPKKRSRFALLFWVISLKNVSEKSLIGRDSFLNLF